MSTWRRHRESDSPSLAGRSQDGPEGLEDVTVPDLFADRGSEGSLADEEWAAEPEGPSSVAEMRPRPTDETRVVPVVADDTAVMPVPVEEPAVLGQPEPVEPPPSRWAGLRDIRVTSMTLYVVAFLLLLGAATAVGVAQFTASTKAPWISVGLSGAAVALTAAALMVRSWP